MQFANRLLTCTSRLAQVGWADMGKKPNRRKEPKKAESVDQGVESSSPNRERLASEDARSRESEPRDGRVRIALEMKGVRGVAPPTKRPPLAGG